MAVARAVVPSAHVGRHGASRPSSTACGVLCCRALFLGLSPTYGLSRGLRRRFADRVGFPPPKALPGLLLAVADGPFGPGHDIFGRDSVGGKLERPALLGAIPRRNKHPSVSTAS